jgi:hypothetical protein
MARHQTTTNTTFLVRSHLDGRRVGNMSYATRACSQLATATSLRRLTGCSNVVSSSTDLNRHAYHSSGLAQRTRIWRLPSTRSNFRGLASSTHQPKAKDLIREETARETNQKDEDIHEREVEASIQQATKQQIKRPWQREGADKPPADESHRTMNKTMTKGDSS